MNELNAIVDHEAVLRLGSFVLVLVLLIAAEHVWPARGDGRPARRQLYNLGLVAIDTAMLRFIFPLLAVLLAVEVHARGGGLFGALEWPLWLEFVLAILAFDAMIYWQHRLLHKLRWFWPLHRVHHSDIAVDATTGLRFHPFEIALSTALKLALVWVLGPHPAAVLSFVILLSAASLFTHADFAFPARAERLVRAVIVTPSMHRIHHSVRREETDSNYGFLLSLWDRLFGSYRAVPEEPERSMPVGLPQWREANALGLGALLLQPFRRTAAARARSGHGP